MERSEESRQWLLKDQERRLEQIDELFKEYEKLNCTFNNIKKMIADLNDQQKVVDDQMTSVRYRMEAQEKKVREINKILRSKDDPTIKSPKDYVGDVSNV